MPSFLWDKARPRCSTCLIAPAEPCACPESICRTREAEQSPGGSSWPPTPPWSRGGARRGLGTASLDFALSPSQPPSPACTAPLQHPGRGSGGFLGSLFGGLSPETLPAAPRSGRAQRAAGHCGKLGSPGGPPGSSGCDRWCCSAHSTTAAGKAPRTEARGGADGHPAGLGP